MTIHGYEEVRPTRNQRREGGWVRVESGKGPGRALGGRWEVAGQRHGGGGVSLP